MNENNNEEYVPYRSNQVVETIEVSKEFIGQIYELVGAARQTLNSVRDVQSISPQTEVFTTDGWQNGTLEDNMKYGIQRMFKALGMYREHGETQALYSKLQESIQQLCNVLEGEAFSDSQIYEMTKNTLQKLSKKETSHITYRVLLSMQHTAEQIGCQYSDSDYRRLNDEIKDKTIALYQKVVKEIESPTIQNIVKQVYYVTGETGFKLPNSHYGNPDTPTSFYSSERKDRK